MRHILKMRGVCATASILRDENGMFMVAPCNFIPYATDVVTTEQCRWEIWAKSCERYGSLTAKILLIFVMGTQNGGMRQQQSSECVDIEITTGKVKFKLVVVEHRNLQTVWSVNLVSSYFITLFSTV